MRSLLICHADDRFDREGLAAWLASFSDLIGIVVLEETAAQRRARVRRELRRVGVLRFADVVAMRLYQRLALRKPERAWMTGALARLRARYGAPPDAPQLVDANINSLAARRFMRARQPDIVIARCKQLLKRKTLAIPGIGCFVVHPGICPEYRNAHGCFWALANRELTRVGVTLLQIDAGVDSGPVYGHYRYAFDERHESHTVIQYRAVLENLDAIAARLQEIAAGSARPINTAGRTSATWGQPWLTRYIAWRRAALAGEAGYATALMYHDIVAPGCSDASGFRGPSAARYKLDLHAFERHLDALARAGLRFPRCDADGATTPACLLTFDDGGASAIDIARRLDAHDMRGHFFIATALIGEPGFVCAADLRALRDAGHVIGSHSHNHPADISRLPAAALDAQWAISTQRLAQILGENVRVGSIPGGFYSHAVAASAAAAGISTLFTSEPVRDVHSVAGCRILGRYTLMRDTPPARAVQLACGHALAGQRQWLAWNLKKPLKRYARPCYGLLRRSLLGT